MKTKYNNNQFDLDYFEENEEGDLNNFVKIGNNRNNKPQNKTVTQTGKNRNKRPWKNYNKRFVNQDEESNDE